MRRWLARLSFSFFIIAFVLAWEAYKSGGAGTRGLLCTIGAVAAFALGIAGVRERHRPDSGDDLQ